MSSFVPKWRHPVGQALMHAGSRPTETRSTQSVHFAIFPVFTWNFGTSNGHPVSQYPQPMQLSGFTSTIPLAYCTMAPGAGQASRHPGSAQCMHWSLRMSHISPPSTSRSSKRMRFQKPASSVGIVWYVPTCRVESGGRSFHSWHATSQALQPMHVDVSMYLATVGTLLMPEGLPQTEAEERRISRLCTLMIVASSRLLEFDEERLELGRPRVRIHGGGRQEIRQRTGMPGVASRVAPVKREADLPELLSVDLEGEQPFRDHRDAFDGSARGGDLHLGSVRDALLLGESDRDLDEETGLELVEDFRVLRPIVVVLRQPVGRAHDREVFLLSVDILVRAELLRHRTRSDFRMEEVIHRRLDGLVMFGERTVVERRGEKSPDALRVHDECAELAGLAVGFDVGNVAHPFLSVPDDARPRRIPRFPFGVRRSAVVHDAAVRGPGETPVVKHPEPGRIGGRAALGVVSRLRVNAEVQPVSAERGAVVLQLPEVLELLARR